jgi:hypothetical protein
MSYIAWLWIRKRDIAERAALSNFRERCCVLASGWTATRMTEPSHLICLEPEISRRNYFVWITLHRHDDCDHSDDGDDSARLFWSTNINQQNTEHSTSNLPSTLKADSHIPCRSPAVPLPYRSFPFDLHNAAVYDSHIPWHGMHKSALCVNQTWLHCVNQNVWIKHGRTV